MMERDKEKRRLAEDNIRHYYWKESGMNLGKKIAYNKSSEGTHSQLNVLSGKLVDTVKIKYSTQLCYSFEVQEI